ncbi:MAG TPA: glycosyltransferase family 39 protein, partial [Phnomibacter sp.]|nr:glycosyltransferase family 39 protein [Phnomibacter sp.]
MQSSALRSFFSSTTWSGVPVPDRRLFIALMVFHFLLSGWFITRTDFTADESDYYGYAIRWAHGDTKRLRPIDDSKSPIVALTLIPNIIKPWVDLSNDPYGFKMLQMGRWFMYVFQWLGAFVLFLWMFRLWGPKHWVLPLVLYLFDPMVFSFGMILGTDMVCASLVLATCYSLWRYTQTGVTRYWIISSIFCALSLVAKASMIYLPVLMLVLLLLQRFTGSTSPMKKLNAGVWVRNIFLLVLLCWIMISAAYQFDHMLFPI